MALGLDQRVQRLPAELQSLIYAHFCEGLDDNDFSFRIFKLPDNVLCSCCLGKKVKPQGESHPMYLNRCRFARRYQEYQLKRESKAETTHSVSSNIHVDEAMFKYFRNISFAMGPESERISIWIYLMTGQRKDRKKVSSYVQVLKNLSPPGIDCSSHQCQSYRCRSCLVSQLLGHVQDRIRQLADLAYPETSQYPLVPWVNKSIEGLLAEFTHVINHIAPASGHPGHGSGVADQLTKNIVQQIQTGTSSLIEAVAQATITPSTGSEDFQQIQICTSKLIDVVAQVTLRPSVKSEDDQTMQDCTSTLIEAIAQATIRRSAESEDLRLALSERLTRLQEVAEPLTVEQPSQKFDNTSCELSPPTVCQTVRTLSPGLDPLLRVGDDPRNRIIIQRSVNMCTGAKNGRDHEGRNDGDDSWMKQQGPWMRAKGDTRCSPDLGLEFDDFEALEIFTERTTKQTRKSITRIELEYDPSEGDWTADAIIQILNTTFPRLKTFCTSVLPVRRLATHPQVWGSSLAKEGDPRWWREREIAYFKALEEVTAHVCLLFRWKSDANWFAQQYAGSGKWRSPGYTEGREAFGEWIFERGF